MRGVNKVILIGNVGSKPEIRYTPNGNPVCNLRLATNESYKDRQTGQLVPKTEWHSVVIFGKPAEFVDQYVDKGSSLYIEGRNQTRKWKDNDTNIERQVTEVVVDIKGRVELLDKASSENSTSYERQSPSPRDDNGYQNNNGGYQQPSASGYIPGSGYAGAVAGEEDDEKDGDIPF
jgi:single-strand DNA-binding protein